MSEDNAKLLPNKWVTTYLSVVGDLYCGQSLPGSQVNTEGKGHLYVTGPEQWDGHKILENKWTETPKRTAPNGCIFVTVKGAGVGKIFPGIQSAIGRDIYAYKPHDSLNPRFVEMAIRFEVQQIIRNATGDIPGLSKSHILEHSISLPPEAEQRRIVEELEKQLSRLDKAVEALRRVQRNLKRYRDSVLKAACEGRLVPTEAELARKEGRDYEPAETLLARILHERRRRWEQAELEKMRAKGKPPKDDKWKNKYKEPVGPDTEGLPELPEGWCWATVEQLASGEANSITDGPFGSNLKTVHYTESGPRVVRLQNIGDGEFIDVKAHISQDHFERLRKHQVFPGDLVIATLGDSPPRACMIPPDFGDSIVKADCIRVSIDSTLANPRFILSALVSHGTRKRTTSKLHGVGRPRLNLSEIRSIVLPLPPREEQNAIVAEIERVIDHIARISEVAFKSDGRSDRLRQSLLKRAFEGKLVPQDPADEPASALLERIRAEREG